MRTALIAAGFLVACSGLAQTSELTAEEVIEKSIEATGGRTAMEKITSTVAKGTMEMPAQGMRSTMEFYAKAPNKRLIVMKIEGMGEILQGFDGTSAWAVTPGGPMEITGDQLEETRRDSTFNAELKWKELYPKAELKGKEKVGERDTYVIELTPKDGKVVKRFYDTQTFLLVRAIMNRTTPQGPVDITADFSDYREVGGGVKAPFSLKQSMAMGDIVMTFTEMKNNVEIDDAKFSKPAK